jgi:hypothetical protein
MLQLLRLSLSQTHLDVYPGTPPTQLLVTIDNGSRNVDEFRLRLGGIDPSWFQLTPNVVRLFPGSQGTATLAIRVPVGTALAGTYTAHLIATSRRDPELAASIELTITVPVLGGVEIEATPERVRCRRHAQSRLLVRNARNSHVRVELRATDPEAALRVEFTPSDLVVGPQGEAMATVAMITPGWRVTGLPRWRGFTIVAIDPEQEPEVVLATTSMQVVHLSVLPWLDALFRAVRQWGILVLIIAVAIVGVIWALGAPGTRLVDEPATPPPALAAANAPGTDPDAAEGRAGQDGAAGGSGALAVAAVAQTGNAAGAQAAAQAQASAGQDQITAALVGPEAAAAARAGGGATGLAANGTPTPVAATIRRFGVVPPPADQAPGAVPLQWDTRGAQSVQLTEATPAPDAGTGTLEERRYILTASNQTTSDTQSLSVYVVRPPTIEELKVDRPAITVGDFVYLTWRTSRATRVLLDGNPVDASAMESGALNLQPTETHTYVLRAENNAGPVSQSVTVNVSPLPTPTPAPTVPVPTLRPTPRPPSR